MRRGAALRVVAPLGGAEMEAGDAEVVDRLLLPRRQVAGDIGELHRALVVAHGALGDAGDQPFAVEPGSTRRSLSAAATGSLISCGLA